MEEQTRDEAEEPTGRHCIIHKESLSIDPNEKLISPQSFESWKTLINAAQVRDHSPILDIAKSVTDKEIPVIFYHRKCRSIFTMKRDLEALKRKTDTSSTEEDAAGCSNAKRPVRRCSSESRIYDYTCIFCENVKRYKGTSTREKLVQSVELRSDRKLRACAVRKCDTKLLAITSRDIVAAEAHYHASCYRDYTRPAPGLETEPAPSQENDIYLEKQDESYAELFHYIRTDILPNKQIIRITTLTEKLRMMMSARGIHSLTESTKKHLRRKLEQELGDCIHIFADTKGKLVVVPDCITIQDIVSEYCDMERELKTWKDKSTNILKIIDQSSSFLRETIKDEKKTTIWPYHPSDVEKESFTAPEYLRRFLIGLLTGDPEQKHPSRRVTMLTESFRQDVVYAVTCGMQKPPKHILLPYMVKTLTGNTELIRTLNRLGHGISYSQLEENDTALCLQKLAANLNQQTLIPTSIQPYTFTNLAWDNIDRLEETLSGKGTSHCVNGIVVQARVYGPHLPKQALPEIAKKKQRSLDVSDHELTTYIAGQRVGPQLLTTDTNIVTESTAANKNLIWILARMTDAEKQRIPSWTGFNINTRDSLTASKDVVGYMPTINAPATELTTVAEILNQSELVRTALQLEEIVVVLDQALYAKAAEIIWKHTDKYSQIILRLGTFHTICNILAILGARFQDAGLRDLCIETNLTAEGSLASVFSGKMYNRAVYVHKSVYEAFMILAWEAFIPWVEKNKPEEKNNITSVSEEVSDLVEHLCQQKFDNILANPKYSELVTTWNEFLDHLRHDNGELSAFWMSYVDIVENVLLALLRAAREGNWLLHLSAIRNMIPWCFAYDRFNYARYLPAYYAEMTNLAANHPAVYQAFLGGSFSVQLSSHNTFGRIPVDQTTEVTVNKDTQTPGGTTRFSLKSGAVKRYYITAEHRSAFLGQMREMVHGDGSNVPHADLHKTCVKKDVDAVSTIVHMVKSWVNPFEEAHKLISISTAKKAPEDICSDLKNARDIGVQCYTNFKAERLETDPPIKRFHDPMKMNKLKTFSNLCKKKQVKMSGRSVILQADRALFGRIIVMAQGRNLQMADVLSHPLGPLP